jgi:hypothetical protein
MYPHSVDSGEAVGTVSVTVVCPSCNKGITFAVPEAGYRAWKGGQYIQNAMPTVNKNLREMLTNGLCPECFNEAATEDEDDEGWEWATDSDEEE